MLKNKKAKFIALLIIGTLSLSSCGAKTPTVSTSSDNTEIAEKDTAKDTAIELDADTDDKKPDTYIADRTVECQVFIGDAGNSLPSDQENAAINKELIKRTGMSIDFKFTSGKSIENLTTAIASGNTAEMIMYYLNDSSRPEFPILLKAAREGMFLDIAPLIKDKSVYGKYFEDGFLPADTKNNVMFRPEFNGAAYIAHLAIPRYDQTADPKTYYMGGLFIKKSIAEALSLDPKSIRTSDQLHDLLVDIKNGGFTDDNGNPVTPLGPRVWGGNWASFKYPNPADDFGVSGGFGLNKDGTVSHVAETEHVYNQINLARKWLEEGLIHKEFFTMDETRAVEASNSGNSAIIADIHNYMPLIQTGNYLPIGPLNDVNGNNSQYISRKGAYCGWSLSSNCKDPEQVVELINYLATKEGKMLSQYGIEGEHYTLDSNNNPIPTQNVLDLMKNGDTDALKSTGIAFDGSGSLAYQFLFTDDDNQEDFGEPFYGYNADAEKYKISSDMVAYADLNVITYDGLSAASYLSEKPELQADLLPFLNGEAYNDMCIQAVYAKSDEDVKKIVESFRVQLQNAKIGEFEKYLQEVHEKDPVSAINFHQGGIN